MVCYPEDLIIEDALVFVKEPEQSQYLLLSEMIENNLD